MSGESLENASKRVGKIRDRWLDERSKVIDRVLTAKGYPTGTAMAAGGSGLKLDLSGRGSSLDGVFVLVSTLEQYFQRMDDMDLRKDLTDCLILGEEVVLAHVGVVTTSGPARVTDFVSEVEILTAPSDDKHACWLDWMDHGWLVSSKDAPKLVQQLVDHLSKTQGAGLEDYFKATPGAAPVRRSSQSTTD